MGQDEITQRSLRRASAARRCVAALVFIVVFAGSSVYAGLTVGSTARLPVELCCAVPMSLVIALELLPSVSELRRDSLARRQALRAFRRQLDQLPETIHPLEGGSRR